MESVLIAKRLMTPTFMGRSFIFFRQAVHLKHIPKENNQLYFLLLEFIEKKKSSCPICLATEKSVIDYFDILLYERVNDPETRRVIDTSMGFCSKHTALLMRMGDSFGQSMIYRSVLTHIAKTLPSQLPLKKRRIIFPKGIDHKNSYKNKCPACDFEKEFEELYLDEFVLGLEKPEFRKSFAQFSGLCIPHFIKAMEICQKSDTADFLLDTQLKVIDNLIAELDEFILKFDYRFSNQRMGKEKNAWKRAARLLASRHILDDLDQ